VTVELHAPVVVETSEVERFIVGLLREVTEGWDLGAVSGTTLLGSLGLESINLVYLIAELQDRYVLGDALIERLRTDQIDIRELPVTGMAALVIDVGGPR
jgi:hypothetical protein